MGLRPAEVRHHAVAQVFRDVPAESSDRFRRRAMVPGDVLAPFLGVQLRRHRGRAHEVAEQHRQMPPLPRHLQRALVTGRLARTRRQIRLLTVYLMYFLGWGRRTWNA